MGDYTKGPWFVGKMLDPYGAPCIVGDGDSVVAIFPADWNGCTHIPADAKLAAAAPELLEALETLDELWGESEVRGVDFSHAIEQARAAIAKARGEA